MKKLLMLTFTMIVTTATMNLEAVIVRRPLATPRVGVNPVARAAVTPGVVGAPVARAAVRRPLATPRIGVNPVARRAVVR